MSRVTSPPYRTASASEFRAGWPVVLACFCTAVFAWGFGFYGQSVYLAELQRLHGWSASLIASATTGFYLSGAILLALVHRVIERVGPRLLLAGGAIVLGVGAIALSRSAEPWQLYASNLLIAAGWACTTSTAIATTLAYWFNEKRGLAISLALNGASASGFIVAPLLVQFSHRFGLTFTVPMLVLVGLAILLPVIVGGIGTSSANRGALSARSVGGADNRPAFTSQSQALRDLHFWSVALPFALALMAQVGFIIHQVAFLLPRLGPAGVGIAVSAASFAAMVGRLGLGAIVDRLNQRITSAVSFASQAAALALMIALPEQPLALYVGSMVFGLSVGNVITLPALLIQREFATVSFGLVVGLSTAIAQFTFAFGPALLGLIHDVTGDYRAALGVCVVLDIAAAAIIWRPIRSNAV